MLKMWWLVFHGGRKPLQQCRRSMKEKVQGEGAYQNGLESSGTVITKLGTAL